MALKYLADGLSVIEDRLFTVIAIILYHLVLRFLSYNMKIGRAHV